VRRRFLLSFFLFTVVVLVGLEVPLGTVYRQRERQTTIDGLERDATAVSAIAVDDLEHGDIANLRTVSDRFGHQEGEGVTIFDPAGHVLVAVGRTPSSSIRSGLTAQLDRALAGAKPSGIVHRPGPDLLFVATPIGAGRSALGVAVIAAPTTDLAQRVRRNWIELGVVGVIVLAISGGLGLLLARSLTRPLAELDDAVAGLQRGDLGTRAATGSGPPELAEILRRFNAMADRLQELVEAQQAFAADASHQLRTPLTALRLRLESLDAAVGGPDHADLEAAITETHRLSRLVDGLLALAKVEASNPARQVIDVDAIVADRVDAWAPLAEEREIIVRGRTTPPTRAFAVPGYLEQVLDNLIDNALDVSPSHSTVEVIVESTGSWVQVHVVDEGPGLGPIERRRAFDRFWRQDGSGRAQGTGLGLAIVRQLVRLSGGEVELRSQAGKGLDAVVRLESRRGRAAVPVERTAAPNNHDLPVP
jgi:signal transduction histidine kinase